MRILNEAAVKDILQNREKKIENIHKKMFSLYKELKYTDEILESVAFPSLNLSGLPGGKGGHKDLGDVLLKYKRQNYNRSEEIREIMWELVEEEDCINRVWACFHALDDPYYSILYALYVENQLYQTVEDNFDASHKTFEKYRQRGIQLLIQFYESGESIAELMHQQRVTGKKKKDGKGRRNMDIQKKEYEQISLSFTNKNSQIL